MAMRAAIVAELKRALREAGHTYTDVARQLQLSVASVKRLFAAGDFSLERVDQVCELLGLEVAEIIERARNVDAPTRQLTHEQEREIVADPGLFLITWLVLSRTPFEQIVKHYRFSATEVQRFLIRLDRLKVIELQPANRVRLLVNRQFSWRPGGPVQRYIHQRLLREFFNGHFAAAHEEFFFHGDAVSEQALARIQRALQHAARECLEIMERDASVEQPRQGAAFVLALRPWQYSGFAELRRG